MRIAEELDPLSPSVHTCVAALYFHVRQYDLAAEEYQKALELDPNFVPAKASRIDVYLMRSMFDEASAELQQWLPVLPPTTAWVLEAQFRSYVHVISGRTREAKRIILECEEKIAHERDEDIDQQVMGNFAMIHSKLGDKDRALEWLKRCFEARAITPFLVKLSPFFDELTSDPRFDELVKKTGVTERTPHYS